MELLTYSLIITILFLRELVFRSSNIILLILLIRVLLKHLTAKQWNHQTYHSLPKKRSLLELKFENEIRNEIKVIKMS